MKSIMLSIKPEWVCKILNGEKTIEIRKKFPTNYVGWVYIYCTKGKPYLYKTLADTFYLDEVNFKKVNTNYEPVFSGKVVARFWCNKVGVIKCHNCLSIPTMAYTTFADRFYSDTDLQRASCLNGNELMWYLGIKDNEEVGYAIHISNLEIFDRPKELSEFGKTSYCSKCKKYNTVNCWAYGCNMKKCYHRVLTPPQNYYYVDEVEK